MRRRIRINGLIAIGLLRAISVAGQDTSARAGLPWDWTHQHTIFSQPDSLQRLHQIEADPRYWHQMSHTASQQQAKPEVRRPIPLANKVDWSEAISTVDVNFSGAVTYPAKYSFNTADPTPNCADDYVVFAVPLGTSAVANLYAFNNLYVNNSGTGTCAGRTTPSALFTYNVSLNDGRLNSSPVLSLDGAGIAFIEDSASAQFHVLKWKAGNVSSTFGTPWNSSPLPDCAANGAVAPCEYSVVYSTHSATLSVPYVDYATDTAYVTDDAGLIAAIHPVFGGGTPAVVFSFTVSGDAVMTPPVYDSVSKNVFAADANGILHYVRTSATSAGTCASGSPPCIGSTTQTVSNNAPIEDAPIIDSSSGTVFVFTNDGPSSDHAAVVQTNTQLSMRLVAYVGPKGTSPVHSGTFNNAYLNSPGSGLLYVCGTDSSNVPQLYAVSFNGAQMNQGPAAYGPLPLAFSSAGCSPLTEVYNQSAQKDYVFLGVSGACYGDNLTGCLAEFDVTSGFPSGSLATSPESHGTTGIVIDNVSNGISANPSQSNLYFTTLGNEPCTEYTGILANSGNCLVKLTQTGLQ